MASSSPPPQTYAGEPPPSSPTDYKTPLHSPSSYNSTHSFPSPPLDKKSPLQSPSRDQNKELINQSMERISSQKSPLRDQSKELNQSVERVSSQKTPLRDQSKELNQPVERVSSQKSPYRDQTKEEWNQPRQHKPVASPPLSPLKFNPSPSIKIQPPPLSTLSLSEASPSPLTVSNRVINNRSPNFDEEAVESPLRIVSLDQRDRVSDQEVAGSWRNGGESRVVREAIWKAETVWAVVGLRVLTAVFCMVSLSVMAADRTNGWDGDVYTRHHEYVYCLTVNAITFAYSSLQLFSEIHHVRTSKHLIPRPHAYYLDLILDQILAYLLMSASSAAASRNDIWVTRFGGDEFTRKINGSVAMSFLAFISLALSSFNSTYALIRWIS